VKVRRLYRYGIEEALLLAGMVCLVVSFLLAINDHHLNQKTIAIAVCLLFTGISCMIYLRFGYLYAALIGLVAGCMIPFQLSLSPVAERIVLFFVLCGIFIFSLTVDKPENENFRKDRCTIIQACLLIAIYLTVNLQIPGLAGWFIGPTHNIHDFPKIFPPYLYWISYVLTFVIPAAGIFGGIRSHKRLVLTAGLVLSCITLATNKSYLGMTRYAWDPAIMGMVLVVLSVILQRWLDSGPEQKRQGFTAVNLLKPEDRGVSLEDVAAAMTPGAIEDHQPKVQQDAFFEDGRSGGGGATRHF
jgi:CHASE2 domain-containing sensor protein